MNDTEAVRYLMSFTRQAFVYASDDSLYKDTYDLINVTFSPTETLYYESSDCEDRAVLFAYLVRELLKLDVIIIEYDTHANTAVLFDPPIGNDHIFTKVKPIQSVTLQALQTIWVLDKLHQNTATQNIQSLKIKPMVKQYESCFN